MARTRLCSLGVALLAAVVAACSTTPASNVSVAVPCSPNLVSLSVKF